MNLYEFILGIVLIGTVAGAVKSVIGARRQADDRSPEADRLRGEVEMLRDRMAVLERIAVEKESSLEREIEKLRDR